MKKRIISLILIIALCLCSVVFSFTAAGAENADSKSTQVSQLISVAKSQVGYYSSGTTKYGAWLGSPDVAWCAAFVSWCANQAGIPSSVIPYSAGVSSFFKIGTYHFSTDISGYIPNAGDIMIFKPLVSGSRSIYYTSPISGGRYTESSHIGIVVSANASNGTVTIIDGNWGNRVQCRTISLYQNYIAAYVTPRYTSGYTATSGTLPVRQLEYYEVPGFSMKAPEVSVSQNIYPSGSDVTLKWNSISLAQKYKVRVYNSDGERVFVSDVKSAGTVVKGLGDGVYTATVVSVAGTYSSSESTPVCFSVFNIANNISARTVTEGVYTIRSADNGYILGLKSGVVPGDSTLVANMPGDLNLNYKFKISYASDGRYRLYATSALGDMIVDASNDLQITNAKYDKGSLFYIVPQSDGAYTLELADSSGKVVACEVNSIASKYCDVDSASFVGDKSQQWYFCDLLGNRLDITYKSPDNYILDVKTVADNGLLSVSVVTEATDEIDRVRICDSSKPNETLAYASIYTAKDGKYFWTFSIDAPKSDSEYEIDYRLTGKEDYAGIYYKIYVPECADAYVSEIKDISYSIDTEKLYINVTTPATDIISEIKVSLASIPDLYIEKTSEKVKDGNYYVWTVVIDAPEEDTSLCVDYKCKSSGKYAKDYYSLDVKSYENTVSAGVIKSVHQSVLNDRATFIIKTSRELANLSGIMAVGNALEPIYILSHTEADNCLLWTVSADVSQSFGEFVFYPVIDSECLYSEAYTVEVNRECEMFIKNVSHAVDFGKLIFTVETADTDEINRVKLSAADNCAVGLAACSEPVRENGKLFWTLEIDVPTDDVIFCFDVRCTGTLNYVKNYFIFRFNKSIITNVISEELDNEIVFTVYSSIGGFSEIKASTGNTVVCSNDCEVKDGRCVWTVRMPKQQRGSEYSFAIRSAITGAYLSDFYVLIYITSSY